MISAKAQIGNNCKIAANAVVYDNVELGEGSVIGDFCVIGHPAGGDYAGKKLVIGKDAIIRSHTVIYEGSRFGDRLRVGHSAMLREGLEAGINFQAGSFNDLEGDCKIGDWVRFHSNVHVGRGAVIGDLVWIFPYVVLTNDPLPPSWLKEGVTVGDGAVICTSSVILPGAQLGRGAFIAALSRAKGHIPAGALVVGESKIIGTVDRLKHKPSGKQHPWMTHASDNYPPEAKDRIAQIYALLVEDIKELKQQIAVVEGTKVNA